MSLQKIGAFALVVAFVLCILKETGFALALLIGIGVFDLWLEITDRQTISQWIHDKFPPKTDRLIMIGLIAAAFFIFGGWQSMLVVILYTIVGHLFWYGENKKWSK